jgi:hypothetical protein
MTRETKVGLLVGSTFLCLVSLVVASKLRGPDPFDLSEQSEQQNGAAGVPIAQAPPAKPIQPPPVSPTKPPSLSIPNPSPAAPTATVIDPLAPVTPAPIAFSQQDPAIPQPAAPKVAPSDPWADPLHPSPQIAAPAPADPLVPLMTPMPTTEPRPFVGPLQEPRVTSPVATLDPLQKPIPVPPVPAGDPLAVSLPMPLGKASIVEPSDPLAQIKKDSGATLPAPMPLPEVSLPKDPLGPAVQAPITVIPGKKEPLAQPLPPAIVNPMPASPDTKLPVVATPAPGPAKEPALNPPPLTAPVANAPAAAPPKTISIGTIGTIGNEAPVTPAVIAPGGGSNPPVPAIAVGGRDLPKVTSHSDDVRYTAPTDASFAQLSKQVYGNEKYGDALLAYNRQHVLGRTNANLQQNPPILQPNQAIYYPPQNVLESQFGQHIKTVATAVPTVGATPPDVQISPPMPLTNQTPSANPPVAAAGTYTVRQTQHIFAIAQQTLGNGNRWTEILQLNPSLRTEQEIPAGTQLRLPANARTN